MAAPQRITAPTVDVLRALLDAGGDALWGLHIVKAIGRPTGTVYPILARLEEAGWIAGRWEQDGAPGRPPRRLYALTAEGQREGSAIVAEFDRRARERAPRPGAAGAGTVGGLGSIGA